MTIALNTKTVAITAYSTLNACGLGSQALYQALKKNQTKLSPLQLFEVAFEAYVGEIKKPLPSIPSKLSTYKSRNAQVALATLNYQEDVSDVKGRLC